MDTNNMIDWNGKLEAVHEDGRVVDVSIGEEHRERSRLINGPGIHWPLWCDDTDGRVYYTGWTIRNKPAAAVAPAPVDEWGPAIEVGGVRPDWLLDGEPIRLRCADGYESNEGCPTEEFRWWSSDIGDRIVSIRLPAHHPQYIPKPPETPVTGPNGILTGVESLEKLEALARRLAAFYNDGSGRDAEIAAEAILWMRDANEVVRQMDPPIDPDLIKAREIAGNHYGLAQKDGPYMTGANDDFPAVRIALAGIKAGRELGK